ncbi:MAG: DNA cytosine methyltransferase [Cyanobacteria bacterium]|nr:DNA cytosine methyltransferase [Cyanobacteriota bacterium]
MNSLELFSGAGGLAKGLELSGLKHAALVEFNKHAYASLCENFEPRNIFFGDVRDFNLEMLDNIEIVAGGPPCQPFSLGGKHKGEQDNRDMFPYAIRAIEKLKPKAFIFENVKGLLRQTFADYFDYIILRLTYPNLITEAIFDWRQQLDELRKISRHSYSGITYNVQFKLINSANYGVPQTRERVIIVGIRSDLDCLWSFPAETHSSEKLFWDMYVTGEYWEKHKICKSNRPLIDKLIEDKAFRLSEKYGAFEPTFMAWQTVRDTLHNLPNPQSNHGISDHIFRKGARIYPGHTGSTLDLPAKTIKAGDHGVPGGENMIRFPDGKVRYLTVCEAKLLQTFPPDFVIKGVWGEAMRQIGNAVPVLLAEKIGHKLIKTLDTHTLKIPVVKSPIVPLFRQERSDLLNTLSASASP